MWQCYLKLLAGAIHGFMLTDAGIASSLWTSVTLLFSSYCSINLHNPANRTVDGKVEYGPASISGEFKSLLELDGSGFCSRWF